jgi:uncharacterized protein YabN with tetrapyrrole methylase and pyrophosphatase domain
MSTGNKKSGSLVVVGVGIALGQTTLEAKAHIEQADKVYYVISNPAAKHWLEKLNPNSESLYSLYETGKQRIKTYDEMVERVLSAVRQGQDVCAAFYGHPGVFADPGHRAVKIARSEGYSARMLPGVSAEDYLFAELGIDPSRCGCQSFEVTDFLIYSRIYDPTAVVILWQLGAIGDTSFQFKSTKMLIGLKILLERLLPVYGPEHLVTIYEGAMFPVCESKILRIPLRSLMEAEVNTISTLYIPPKRPAAPDLALVRQLGLDQASERAPA